MNPGEVGADSPSEARPAARAWSNPLLAIARLGGFAAWTLYCYCGCLVSRAATSDRAEKRARSAEWTHRWLRRGAPIAGIRIDVRGSLPPAPALLVPNHLGYLDILAVGAACPAVFVSKADVRSWPVVGHLFDMSEHIGVMRSDRRSLSGVNASIAERLDGGLRVCVFLEGTSTDGSRMLPFYASLAQPAVDTGTPIVPVALNWFVDSSSLSISEDVAYWRPEHNFVTHAWRAIGLRGIRVTVSFGDPIPTETGADRKALAAKAREAVAGLLEASRDRA